MKISFDLDGVLWNWTRYAWEYCIEQKLTNLSMEDFLSHEELHTPIFWYNLVRIPMLYYRTKLDNRYLELLNKFNKAGWEVYYLTNRPIEMKVVTYNFLEDSKVPQLKNLYFTEKKSSIIRFNNIDYHIDDRSNCIEDVKNFVTKSFLVDTYWNSSYKEPENCVRISSVLDLEKELL
jgi:uncharacterized HAD superfamily protein